MRCIYISQSFTLVPPLHLSFHISSKTSRLLLYNFCPSHQHNQHQQSFSYKILTHNKYKSNHELDNSTRLQTDKWLSSLFDGGIESLHESQHVLVDLLSLMMGHIEPEQRFIALKHLGNLVGAEADSEIIIDRINSCEESILGSIVSNLWDRIIVVASSDMSPLLRTRAMALIVKCVSFAERPQLQYVLGAADSFLQCLVSLGQKTCEGPFVQLSLALIATICLYSPAEDVCLIPQSIWRNIDTLGLSEGKHEDLVRSACQALCKLKTEGDEAKASLKGVLTSNISKEDDPNFGTTRESLLQVLANLTSVQSYFDFFSKKSDEKLMETPHTLMMSIQFAYKVLREKFMFATRLAGKLS